MPQTARMFLATLTLMGVLFLVPHTRSASLPTVRYAKVGGAITGNCDSWANACSLPTALSVALPMDSVWVATGIYQTNGRNNSFFIKSGVKAYGGFAGGEERIEERDINRYPTVLSGDTLYNDNANVDPSEQTRQDNAYHVVVAQDSTSLLDGFTITGGNANGPTSDPVSYGGGMYNDSVSPTLKNVIFLKNSAIFGGGMANSSDSSPTLINVTFSDNSATNGGGTHNYSSSPTLINVAFSDNSASNVGGGMFNLASSPTLTNVTFSDNSAGNGGGGMFNIVSSMPTLTDLTFSDNTASVNGGGMYNAGSSPILTHVNFSGNSATERGGGMYNDDSSSPRLTSVTFSGNEAGSGGGMYNNKSSKPTLTDVSFSDNSAAYGGGMYNNVNSNPALTRVTFSHNSATNSGGGMVNAGSSIPVLTNVTFSNNAAELGGGMYNSAGSPVLSNVTFSHNSATANFGGMYNVSNSRPLLTNVIIANSTGGDCFNQLGTTLNSASSHNLIEDTGTNACGLNSNVNIIGVDPKLGPLAGNGGATLTHALLPDSPAINAGKDSACPATDQRGIPRPQGGVCDIGAFEVVYLFLPLVRR